MKWNRRLAGRASRSCRTESAEQEDVRPEVAPARWGWFVWVMPLPGAGPVTTAPEPRRASHTAVGARRAPPSADPHEPPPASRPRAALHSPRSDTSARALALGLGLALATGAADSGSVARARAPRLGSLLGLGLELPARARLLGLELPRLGSLPWLGLELGLPARARCSGSSSLLRLGLCAPFSGSGSALPAPRSGPGSLLRLGLSAPPPRPCSVLCSCRADPHPATIPPGPPVAAVL